MTLDISDILRHWPHEAGQITARKIRGRDGRWKVQMRLDLGLLQMEMDGRPDGSRPHGFDSVLDYHQSRLKDYRNENNTDYGFVLSPEECAALREEGLQYYYRYLCLFHLEEFELVERDTYRNMVLFDLVRDHADREEDRMSLEAYRPYVVMMNAQARSRRLLYEGEYRKALDVVLKGLEDIRKFLRTVGHEPTEETGEVAALKQLADEILKLTPKPPIELLRERMQKAVEREDFTLAARLRDEIRDLQTQDIEA